MILVISSRAIVRFMSSLLTIQMIINLGLTSFDYPGNMNFLIRYLKTRFQGRTLPGDYITGLGELIGF